MVVKYGLHDQGFSVPDPAGHLGNEDPVAYGHRSIARKEKVMKGTEGVMFVAQVTGKRVALQGNSLNQLFG